MTLPVSVALAVWGGAVAAGRCRADEALVAVVGDDEPHHVVGTAGFVPPDELPLPDPAWLSDLLVLLAAAGEQAPVTVRCALPEPGDVRGVPGPVELAGAAVDAGECVVVADLARHAGPTGPALALVPEVERFGSAAEPGRRVTWRAWRPAAAGAGVTGAVASLAEADLALRVALADATQALERLDVASWRTAAGEQALRRGGGRAGGQLGGQLDLPLPPTLSPRALRLLTRAEQVLRICEAAALDDGGALTSWESTGRATAVSEAARAARVALAAAVNLPG